MKCFLSKVRLKLKWARPWGLLDDSPLDNPLGPLDSLVQVFGVSCGVPEAPRPSILVELAMCKVKAKAEAARDV